MMIAFDIQRDEMTDEQYDEFVSRMGDNFADSAELPLFRVDAGDLWDVYLAAFPIDTRQYHNCNTCKDFVRRYGSLVTIAEDGRINTAVWHDNAARGTCYEAPFAALRDAVESRRNRVSGVFLSSVRRLGEQRKGRRVKSMPDGPSNEWSHLFVDLPESAVYRGRLLTAGQAAAEKSEDYRHVMRALAEFRLDTLDQALELLNTDALYRSEKVVGPVQWLRDLKAATESTRDSRVRSNLVWRAISTAPAGFCHPRSSMAGTLLEDLATGNGFDWASKRFKSKMHPLQYQRPQAAPSGGQIDAAEKLVAKLGIGRSLERRFARLDEIQTIWTPQNEPKRDGEGVFGHLRKGSNASELEVPTKSITWEKFAEKVLPTANRVELLVPSHGNYCAFLTALHDDAPPIHQWDSEDRRNPFSLYVYSGGSSAYQWGLVPGWINVVAMSLRPSHWQSGFDHQSEGVMLVLPGCVDSKRDQGNALFPETLKADLRQARSVIEAHSRRSQIHGREQASACGYLVGKDARAKLRVHGSVGVVSQYLIDRWE